MSGKGADRWGCVCVHCARQSIIWMRIAKRTAIIQGLISKGDGFESMCRFRIGFYKAAGSYRRKRGSLKTKHRHWRVTTSLTSDPEPCLLTTGATRELLQASFWTMPQLSNQYSSLEKLLLYHLWLHNASLSSKGSTFQRSLGSACYWHHFCT